MSDLDLDWLPAPDALAGSVRDVAASTEEPPGLTTLLLDAGAPLRELCPTPISARVAALGASDGRVYAHHELRRAIPLAPELQPETAVWEHEDPTPRWEEGVLITPKYFSFFLEEVMAPYDPNHRIKWRAHEMLHRLVGFFWRPDLSRFEAYVGARLSELLPVVHWYGLDEIARPRCPRHLGQVLYREHCPDCEQLARPYWRHEGPLTEAAHDERHGAAAIEHLRSELEACVREIETGRQHPVARPHLDAASDAVGYLLGHWPRLTAWSFGAWIEHFMVAGEDYVTSTAALAERVATTARTIMTKELQIDAEAAARRRVRRGLQDLGYRALLALEHADDEGVDAVWPALEEVAAHAGALQEPSSTAAIDSARESGARLLTALADRAGLPEPVRHALPAQGHVAAPSGRIAPEALPGLVAGLQSGLSDTLVSGRDETLLPVAWSFARSPSFGGPEELRVRFAGFVQHESPDGLDADAIALESWLRRRPHRDAEAERFGGVPPEDTTELGPGRLRPNATFRRGIFPGETATHLLDWPPGEERVELCAVWLHGEPRVVEVTPELVAILEAIDEGRALPLDEDLRSLIEGGVLVWLPTPR